MSPDSRVRHMCEHPLLHTRKVRVGTVAACEVLAIEGGILADQWKDSIDSQYADAQSTMSDSEDIRSSPSGEAVEMVRIESTYTHKGVGVRATTWVQAFTTIDTPTAVFVCLQ